MASKRNMQPLAHGDIVLMDGKFMLTLKQLELLALTATGVTGSGIVLANANQRFSLMTPTFKDDGSPAGELPVNYTVSVRITRDAIPGADTPRQWQIGEKVITATEAEAIAVAAAVSKANQKARKDAETELRERAVAAAQQLTRDMITQGIAIGAQNSPKTPDVVSTVKTAVELTKVLKELNTSAA